MWVGAGVDRPYLSVAPSPQALLLPFAPQRLDDMLPSWESAVVCAVADCAIAVRTARGPGPQPNGEVAEGLSSAFDPVGTLTEALCLSIVCRA